MLMSLFNLAEMGKQIQMNIQIKVRPVGLINIINTPSFMKVVRTTVSLGWRMVDGRKTLCDVHTPKAMDSNHVIPSLPNDVFCLVLKIKRIPWGTRLERHPHYPVFVISGG